MNGYLKVTVTAFSAVMVIYFIACAYVDDYSTSMSLSALLESDKSQLDGTVAAGKKMNGTIGYEAPADWKEIEVRFTPDFWRGKDITFIHSK